VSDEAKKALQAEVVAVKTRWSDEVKMKKAKDGPNAPLPLAVSRTIQKPLPAAELWDVEELTVRLWIDTLVPYTGVENAPVRVEVLGEFTSGGEHVQEVMAEHVLKRWRAELKARGVGKGWMLEKILGWAESAYIDLLSLDPLYVDSYMGVNEEGMTIRRYAIQEPAPEPESESESESEEEEDIDGIDDIDMKVKRMGLSEEEERQMRIKLKAEAEADRQWREERRREHEAEFGTEGERQKPLNKKEKKAAAEEKEKKAGSRLRKAGAKHNKFDAEAAGKKANKKNGLLH